MSHDVFISYSSKDQQVADAACAILERRGVRCWIAHRDATPGVAYGEAIINAIADSRVMVLVFSANANGSDQVSKEVERAVNRGVIIVPFRIEDVQPVKSLDYFIGSVHWLDAMTPPMEQHLERLAQTVRQLLSGKTPPIGGEPAILDHHGSGSIRDPGAAVSPRGPAATNRRALLIGAGVIGALVIGLGLWRLVGRTDPLVGNWTWPNGAVVTISKDGTITAGLLAGQWRSTGSHHYALTWPPAVDQAALSADGTRLHGANQYGVPLAAIRLSPPTVELAGNWRWANGVTVTIDPSGGLQAGSLQGRWVAVDPTARTFAFTWPSPVDLITLSDDGRRIQGGNQYGFPLTATRVGN
jgi:hypothetical protein